MYNEILKGVLDSIRETPESLEGKDERVINERVTQALRDRGVMDTVCSAVFLNWGIRIEGLLFNDRGETFSKFRYDFENGELESNL